MTFTRYRGGLLPAHRDDTHPRLWMDEFLAPVRVPDTIDWTTRVSGYPMDRNDQLGICVVAMGDHAQMTWNASAHGTYASWGDALCTQVYSAVGGYVEGDPSTDNGLVIQDFLDFWRHNDIGGSKISFYGALRPGSWHRDWRLRALQAAGGLMIGLNLPVSAEQQFPNPWEPVPFSPIAGGHGVFQSGELRVRDEIELVSWGAVVKASKAFVMDYTAEAWVAFGPDFTELDGQNPSGMDVAAVNEALAALTGEINPLGLRSVFAVPEFATGGTVTMPDEAVNEPQAEQPDPRDAEIAKLRAELAAAEAEAGQAPAVPEQPAVFNQHKPEETFSVAPLASASNESPVLPAGAHAAAVRAHGVFTHLIAIAQAAQAEIEKYVPASMLQSAEDEGRRFIREIL